MPWHLMSEACFEMAGGAGHDRVFISARMNLTGAAIGSKAICEVRKLFDRRDE